MSLRASSPKPRWPPSLSGGDVSRHQTYATPSSTNPNRQPPTGRDRRPHFPHPWMAAQALIDQVLTERSVMLHHLRLPVLADRRTAPHQAAATIRVHIHPETYPSRPSTPHAQVVTKPHQQQHRAPRPPPPPHPNTRCRSNDPTGWHCPRPSSTPGPNPRATHCPIRGYIACPLGTWSANRPGRHIRCPNLALPVCPLPHFRVDLHHPCGPQGSRGARRSQRGRLQLRCQRPLHGPLRYSSRIHTSNGGHLCCRGPRSVPRGAQSS